MDNEAIIKVDIPGLNKVKSGKVRELFDLGEALVFVATDRISAFDCVMPNGIPQKGIALTQLSHFWFSYLESVVPNHRLYRPGDDLPPALSDLDASLKDRLMVVRKTKPLAIECVVRGYLAGSGWKEYCEKGSVCGIPLPSGLKESARLEAPIFTPATKAEKGHDENISYDEAADLVGAEIVERARELSLNIYEQAREYALGKGLIIADTKFEFGLDGEALILIDEVLTSDSSRFWPASDYQEGRGQKAFDKQFVRDYLLGLDWDKTPPAPALPADIVDKTRERYWEAYRLLTGRDLRF